MVVVVVVVVVVVLLRSETSVSTMYRIGIINTGE